MTALSNLVSKMYHGIVNWVSQKVERSRILNELYAMDDRTLADIGITRGDIEDVVNGKMVRTSLDPVAANIEFLKHSTFAKTETTVSTDTKIAA
ncbi:MAG: DUF1127 domain-containing protein [Rhodospirillales bacterium]|nr:DUF1127 domain-containing protein [Rhodospirillales bacterium]